LTSGDISGEVRGQAEARQCWPQEPQDHKKGERAWLSVMVTMELYAHLPLWDELLLNVACPLVMDNEGWSFWKPSAAWPGPSLYSNASRPSTFVCSTEAVGSASKRKRYLSSRSWEVPHAYVKLAYACVPHGTQHRQQSTSPYIL
jgi:hypothetical protein